MYKYSIMNLKTRLIPKNFLFLVQWTEELDYFRDFFVKIEIISYLNQIETDKIRKTERPRMSERLKQKNMIEKQKINIESKHRTAAHPHPPAPHKVK